MSRKKWDLTSMSSLRATAKWLRKNADSQLLVICGEDVACPLDPLISPTDALTMVEGIYLDTLIAS